MNANLIRTGVMAGLAFLGISCTQSGEEVGTSPNRVLTAPLDPGKSLEKETSPIPLASLTLPNGNQLEISDIESSLLITESGVAGTASGMPKDFKQSFLEKDFASPGDRLLSIWNKLAPASPVPEAIQAFHLRWKDRPANAPARIRTPVSLDISGPNLLGPKEISGPMAKKAAPDGCNNGCCDFQWLSTFAECMPEWDVSWFFFNSMFNRANVPDSEVLVSMVCAANGTSQWKYSIDGINRNLSIAPATFKRFWWSAGWFDQDFTSSVNSSAAPRLHTYCGDVNR